MKSNKISACLSWHCYKLGESFASIEKGILVQTSKLM